MSATVELQHVTKRFGTFTAVDAVDLSIHAGEFLTLLGPSGCGKTTLLRMIGGFETPTTGRVLLDGRDVTHVPPYRREVNQVFQGYALFPHLSVRDNIAFGLRMKKINSSEIARRVGEAVAMVALAGLEDRAPHQLSGGQKQRVALARAIVNRPKVLLLDEPLSALDAKLRGAMRGELKNLQKSLGITFVFVTHDQEEALSLSDRVAVMHAGRIAQLAAPADIYHRPRTAFVADFVGSANLLSGEIESRESGAVTVRVGPNLVLIASATDAVQPSRLRLSIRPERITLTPARPAGENAFPVTLGPRQFKGATQEQIVFTDGGIALNALVAHDAEMSGRSAWAHVARADVVILEDEEFD